MPVISQFLQELEHETRTTRRVLERVPADRLDWKPNPKSSSLGQLAFHVAAIPGRLSALAVKGGMETAGRPPQPAPESKEQILERVDASLAEAKAALGTLDDAALADTWTITRGGQQLLAMPRGNMLRTFIMSHLIHHRGQLTVYLRLLDVPLPTVYGPTADEMIA